MNPKEFPMLDSPLIQWSSIEALAYEAAIMDGEGSIGLNLRGDASVRKVKGYMTPVVQVSNTFEPLCRHFHSKYGGRIWVNVDKRTTRKTLYLWSVAGQKAVVVLEALYPYLWLKKRQAELVFEFYKGKQITNRLSDAEAMRRFSLYDEMKRLNMRGVSPYAN